MIVGENHLVAFYEHPVSALFVKNAALSTTPPSTTGMQFKELELFKSTAVS
jgi:hypothetical protein